MHRRLRRELTILPPTGQECAWRPEGGWEVATAVLVRACGGARGRRWSGLLGGGWRRGRQCV